MFAAAVRNWLVTGMAGAGRSGSAAWGTPAAAAISGGDLLDMPAFDLERTPRCVVWKIKKASEANSGPALTIVGAMARVDTFERSIATPI